MRTSGEDRLAEEVDELPYSVLLEDPSQYDPRSIRMNFPESINSEDYKIVSIKQSYII